MDVRTKLMRDSLCCRSSMEERRYCPLGSANGPANPVRMRTKIRRFFEARRSAPLIGYAPFNYERRFIETHTGKQGIFIIGQPDDYGNIGGLNQKHL
jgi:hypothetical protein